MMVLATPIRLTRSLCSAVLLALSCACSVVNNDHCGNNDGDATCRLRDPARPHCSVCVADNDGCLAAPPPADCLANTASTTTPNASTSAPTSTGDPPTSTTTGSTGAPDTSSTGAPDTSSTSTGDPGTSTTSTTSTSDASSTGDTTAGTTMSGPVCGDNKAEGDEVCDTKDFKGKTCETVDPKWGGGSLICNECLSLDDADCCVGLNGACGVLQPDPKLPCCGGGLTCKFGGLNLFTCKN